MKTRTFHADRSQPQPGEIFVFGSNQAGYHGGGAARAAHQQYGAEWGVPEGATGNSYAIPTCDAAINPLPLAQIGDAVQRFLAEAVAHPERSYFVTRIGCGIAGHRDSDIAPMFSGAPSNCSLPDTWAPYF